MDWIAPTMNKQGSHHEIGLWEPPILLKEW